MDISPYLLQLQVNDTVIITVMLFPISKMTIAKYCHDFYLISNDYNDSWH